jgi:hypothetical protein
LLFAPWQLTTMGSVDDFAGLNPACKRTSQPQHATAAQTAQTEEDLHQGRFAGPVLAQQRADLAGSTTKLTPRKACTVALGRNGAR